MVDPVWEHGQKYKSGFVCKYCRQQRSGGGATRFKEHLAHRGNDAKDCPSVPAEVKKFFIEQLDKNKERARARARDKLLRDAAARRRTLTLIQRRKRATAKGRPHYERGGGSGSGSRAGGSRVRGSGVGGGAGPLPSMFTRSQSHVPERVRDYHFGLSSAPVQQRIDTGPWTVKGRTSRELIGRAWAKACHAIGIPGRKVDDPYFKAAIMETQKQGVGIKIPSGREIDGKYLDENVKEIEKEIEKWKMEWDECGVTLILHSMMRQAIGGELVKWNATRFGTNYMFLESMFKKKDQFMVWLMSPEFRRTRHFNTEMG
ncbi:hypothetical protein U9M48_042581, partial [Paspalum notatum var. saurae]